MNEKMLKVMQGFASLDYTERTELVTHINEFQSKISERPQLMESLAKQAGVPLGPTGQGGCPCCGR